MHAAYTFLQKMFGQYEWRESILNGFRNKLFRFLEGRYGFRGVSDSVQIVICCVYLLLVVLNMFVRSRIISAILLVLLGYTLFRVLSKNIPARENEDRAVREWLFRLRDAFQNQSRQAEIRKGERAAKKEKRAVEQERRKDKEHIYRECPECGATLRLPRKKGKHSVICPRCGNKFGVKC